MSITLDDIKTAVGIIDNFEGSEITLRYGDLSLIVRRGNAAPPASLATDPAPMPTPVVRELEMATPVASSQPSETDTPAANTILLKAPLSGIIYLQPAPEEPPFVTPGAIVGSEDVVCIIDVMKVMNLIKTPGAGRISRIFVRDGQNVNKGDTILWVEPA